MIKTRFAPSPTGYLHIGGARTALFSWLYARKQGGTFVLRIEDTDLERSTPASVQAILDGMQWLGLDYDEGPYYQTQRFGRYADIVQQLIRDDHAYYCTCSKERLETLRAEQMANKEKPRYDGHCRDRQYTPTPGEQAVIRFRNPQDGEVTFDDQIRGRITIRNSELDDLIIARGDGSPTYNFCVVIDDWEMGITHVIRGDDHINNTPRQINIFRALGATPPAFAHVPMILGSDGKRLSKRHGAVSVMQYRDEGFLPEALLNYLVRLGWSHGDQEIFSREELIDRFNLEAVNKAPAAFNPEKLLWLNQHYLKTLPPEHVATHLDWQMAQSGVDTTQGPALFEVVTGFCERAKTLKEMAASSAFLYREFAAYDEKAAKKHLNGAARGPLEALYAALAVLNDWRAETIHHAVASVGEKFGGNMGKVAQPARTAVSGTAVSPPIDVTLALLGKEKTLARLVRALAALQ